MIKRYTLSVPFYLLGIFKSFGNLICSEEKIFDIAYSNFMFTGIKESNKIERDLYSILKFDMDKNFKHYTK